VTVLPYSKNISTARILHHVCPKNIFSPEFGEHMSSLPPSPTPMFKIHCPDSPTNAHQNDSSNRSRVGIAGERG